MGSPEAVVNTIRNQRPCYTIYCPCGAAKFLSAILLEFPVSVVQWADMTGLQPSGDTVEVERVLGNSQPSVRSPHASNNNNGLSHIANPPSNGALFACGRRLVGLALDAEVHDMISADGAVIDHNVPSPEGNSIPLSLHCQRERERELAWLRKVVAGQRSNHLLDLESLLAVIFSIGLGTLTLRGSNGVARGICHVHVGHSDDLVICTRTSMQRRFGYGVDGVL